MTRPARRGGRRSTPEEVETPAAVEQTEPQETEARQTEAEFPLAPPTPRALDRNRDDRPANAQPVSGGRDLSRDASPVLAAPTEEAPAPAPAPTPSNDEA